MDNIFLPNKNKFGKKKKIAAARLATITATCWTGNRLFFVDSLRKAHKSRSMRFSFQVES